MTSPCIGWEAIYPSRSDVLTDQTAKQIRSHDQYGVKLNCWPAPKPHKPVPYTPSSAKGA